MGTSELAAEFSAYAGTRLADSLAQIERCLHLLSDEQIWHRPNDVSNAVGNLVVHLNGNVRQWILGGVAGQPIARDRAAEFAQRAVLPRDQILTALRQTVAEARGVLSQLDAPDLARQISIQGYDVTVLAAVFHVVEHFSLHTGQPV